MADEAPGLRVQRHSDVASMVGLASRFTGVSPEKSADEWNAYALTTLAAEDSARYEDLADDFRLGRHPLAFALAWFRSGLPRVTVGHRVAAALMATQVPIEIANALEAPWDAFVVDVPHGLLEGAGHMAGTPVSNYLVWRRNDDNGRSVLMCDRLPRAYRDRPWVQLEGIVEHLQTNERLVGHPVGDTAQNARCGILGMRYLLGVLLELNEHRPARDHATGPRTVRLSRLGEPRVTTFQVTRDVKIDARDAVREYTLGGSRSAPSVQCLVRGHWKMQPHGPRSAQRKYIWVQPYWRGPEDAPMAFRSHLLGVEPIPPSATE